MLHASLDSRRESAQETLRDELPRRENPHSRRPPGGESVRGFFGRVSRNRRQPGAAVTSQKTIVAAILQRRTRAGGKRWQRKRERRKLFREASPRKKRRPCPRRFARNRTR